MFNEAGSAGSLVREVIMMSHPQWSCDLIGLPPWCQIDTRWEQRTIFDWGPLQPVSKMLDWLVDMRAMREPREPTYSGNSPTRETTETSARHLHAKLCQVRSIARTTVNLHLFPLHIFESI